MQSALAASGDYRSGVAFAAGNTFYGKEAGDSLRRGSFDATLAATQTNAYPTADFPSAVAPIGVDTTNNLLVRVITTANAGAVRLYDISDPSVSPTLLDTDLTTGNTNGNAAGDVEIGNGMVYVLATNNGLYAYNIVVPEPATLGVAGIAGLPALARRRRV